jgi:hypothetical protein
MLQLAHGVFKRANLLYNRMRLATEYQMGNTAGTVDTQQYWNTTMTLEQHDPNLASTLKPGGQIKATKMHTPDGGKTWIIDHVSIPAKSPGAASRPG